MDGIMSGSPPVPINMHGKIHGWRSEYSYIYRQLIQKNEYGNYSYPNFWEPNYIWLKSLFAETRIFLNCRNSYLLHFFYKNSFKFLLFGYFNHIPKRIGTAAYNYLLRSGEVHCPPPLLFNYPYIGMFLVWKPLYVVGLLLGWYA